MTTYRYQPYPRRLYLYGEVIPDDLHATNSVVVESAEEESAARARGYGFAWERGIPRPADGKIECGNGGSDESAPVLHPLPPDQGIVAVASASIPDEIDSLRCLARSLGLNPHHRTGPTKLREMIAAAQAQMAKAAE